MFNMGRFYHSPWTPLIAIGVILIVFTAALTIDLARSALFDLTIDRNPAKWFDLSYHKAIESLHRHETAKEHAKDHAMNNVAN